MQTSSPAPAASATQGHVPAPAAGAKGAEPSSHRINEPARGLLDPRVVHKIRDQVGANDPILCDFFGTYMEEGPMAAMRHLGTPSVTTRLAALMAEATNVRPGGPGTGYTHSPRPGVQTRSWSR